MMRELISEPRDNRPIVAECLMCGRPIYGADDEHYAETFFVIDSDCVCEDCTTDYLNKYCRRGD